MLRKSFLCRIVFCLLAGLGSGYTVYAQDTTRGERYFKELDRDNDGTLSEDEFKRADDRMRDRLKDAGVTWRPGLKLPDFVAASEKIEEARQKERERERESRGDSSDRGGDRGSSRGKPKEKVKVNIALPVTYVPFDKNADGQIGLYEWERAKFAEFRALDRNGDGFLSPRELVSAATSVAAGSTPSITRTVPSMSATPTAMVAPPVAPPGTPAVANAPVKPTPAVVVTPPEEDRETKVAKVFFKGLDKNSDGEISQEEWTESRGVRVKFEQANVSPPLPLDEEEFIKQYRAVEQKKTTST